MTMDTFTPSPKIQPSVSAQSDAVGDLFPYVIMMSSWERIVLKENSRDTILTWQV